MDLGADQTCGYTVYPCVDEQVKQRAGFLPPIPPCIEREGFSGGGARARLWSLPDAQTKKAALHLQVSSTGLAVALAPTLYTALATPHGADLVPSTPTSQGILIWTTSARRGLPGVRVSSHGREAGEVFW